MTKTMSVLAAAIGLSLGFVSSVSAQSTQAGRPESAQPGQVPATQGEPEAQTADLPPNYFLNVNAGAQPVRRTLGTVNSFPLYDETATIAANYHVRNGAMFEIAGGRHLWRSLTIGASISMFSRSGTGDVTATIPDPLFFDRPAVFAGLPLGALEHKELGVNVIASWWLPVTDKIDVQISVGPSFIRVSQEVVTAANVTAGTQNISSFTRETQTGTAVGVNGGLDATYMLTRHYGAGLFVKYAGGTVDLPAVPKVKVGGLQAGLGVRLRF